MDDVLSIVILVAGGTLPVALQHYITQCNIMGRGLTHVAVH